MPEYRVTVKFVVGDPVQGVRHYPWYDLERAKKHFEQKVYDHYGKAKVTSIEIERVPEPGVEMLGD